MIGHRGCQISVRLVLAVLLAFPITDALAAVMGSAKGRETVSSGDAGWRKDPVSSVARIVAAASEDFDENDDAPDFQPAQDLGVRDGFGVLWVISSGSISNPGVGRESFSLSMYKSLCRFRC